ncbi:ogt, partial [Symbiodinium sp. CCMP2456]
ALKRNPHAPVVPCHRIVRADRSLGGYFGATALEDAHMKTKVRLLEEEGVLLERKRDALFVKAECFWHFPASVDLEAIPLPQNSPVESMPKVSLYPAKRRRAGDGDSHG